MTGAEQPPGWYPAEGDPPGTVRWWDGTKWVGGPQAQGVQQQAGYVAPGAGALANGRELADPWMRIAAAVIDGILIGIVGAVFGVAAAVSSGFSGDSGEFDFVPDGRAIVLGLIGSIINGVRFLRSRQEWLDLLSGRLNRTTTEPRPSLQLHE